MNFIISVPELCLIRFCVRDQTGLLSSEFVGQYTLPFTSMMKGEPQGSTRCHISSHNTVEPSLNFPNHSQCQHNRRLLLLLLFDIENDIFCLYNTSVCCKRMHFLSRLPFFSTSRLPLGASPVSRRMQPGSSFPLHLCLVFLKTALDICLAHTNTHQLPAPQ